jgi:hypothetical protein
MNRYLPFVALAIGVMSNAFSPSLKAAEYDEKTIFTTSQTVAVQGTILPAGQYVLKLLDPASTRQVIAIFNSDQTRLVATVLAIRAYRLDATGTSDFSFYDSSAGQPPALHTWFYPGYLSGYEFLQRDESGK